MQEQEHCGLQTDEKYIRKRFDTLVKIYEGQFVVGLDERYSQHIHLNLELLHCAVNAYFDDICKYKSYAGSQFADRHKQAAFTMLWISHFKPIQIDKGAETDTTLLTVNETFAIYTGLTFLQREVLDGLTEKFFWHLVYMLTYRQTDGRSLATIMYLMEQASLKTGTF